jgi:hypothetical protein
MTYHGFPVSLPLQTVPADRGDHENDAPLDSPDCDNDSRPAAPTGSTPKQRPDWERVYERSIYGDERGGQLPKRPKRP